MAKNGLHIDKDGTRCWYLNDKRHRTDGPAVERLNGDKAWWLNDTLHRTDGPAVEWADGTKRWYLNGVRHRTDGPAVECADGTKVWYLNGERLDDGDSGFWALWERLTSDQRNNLNLLMHLPKI